MDQRFVSDVTCDSLLHGVAVATAVRITCVPKERRADRGEFLAARSSVSHGPARDPGGRELTAAIHPTRNGDLDPWSLAASSLGGYGRCARRAGRRGQKRARIDSGAASAVRDVGSGVRIGLYRRGDGVRRSGRPMSFGPFAGTYDPLFRGSWIKWAHGLSHAQALDADIETFNFHGHRDPLLGVQADYDPRRHGFSVRATEVAPVPSHWGLMLGDVAHNYRSALDHLAWAVVCRGRKPPSALTEGQQRAVQFPIADERAAFNGSLGSRL